MTLLVPCIFTQSSALGYVCLNNSNWRLQQEKKKLTVERSSKRRRENETKRRSRGRKKNPSTKKKKISLLTNWISKGYDKSSPERIDVSQSIMCNPFFFLPPLLCLLNVTIVAAFVATPAAALACEAMARNGKPIYLNICATFLFLHRLCRHHHRNRIFQSQTVSGHS